MLPNSKSDRLCLIWQAATVEGLETKLTKGQRSEIAMNNALLTMYTNQVDHCRDLVRGLVETGALTQAEGDMMVAGAFSRYTHSLGTKGQSLSLTP